MILQGDRSTLMQMLLTMCPDVPKAAAVKLQMLDYQMAALYILAKRYNRTTARMLEIGTGYGGSGFMLARAAPMAQILSLTTNPVEKAKAQAFWLSQGCLNITALVMASWDFFVKTSQHSNAFDLIFVDGDHNKIARDLPWFNRLTPGTATPLGSPRGMGPSVGGLLLCHDYSLESSPIVFKELNELAARLGRVFDVRLIDDLGVGMAGFYRRHGEMI